MKLIKITIKALTFLTILISSFSAWAAPAYVQGNYREAVGTKGSASFSDPVLAGSLLVVVLRDGGANANVTCTSGGRSFTLDAHESFLGWGFNVLSLPNAAGGATSVSCTLNKSTDQIRMTVLEFSGVATSSPTVDTATDTGSGLPSAGPVTTKEANSLLVFAAASDGDAYHSVPKSASGWTLINLWFGGAGEPDKTAEEWRIAANAGSYNGSYSSVSSDYAAILVAYAPSGTQSPTSNKPNPPDNLRVVSP